jgi:hypothetical protein
MDYSLIQIREVLLMKMSKAQGRKRLSEMSSKAKKLFMVGYISTKELESIERIVKLRSGQLK